MRVHAYAIAKDEERNVDQWLHHTRHCDSRLVVDTGSSDRTVHLLQSAGVSVIERAWAPFRFDAARNLALSQFPNSSDWLISPDFDEYFDDGWRDRLERCVALNPDATMVTYPVIFHYSDRCEPGLNPGKKIHINRYRWEQPVHEYLCYLGTGSDRAVAAEGILQHHLQDPAVPREQRYFDLARQHLEYEPQSAWLLWFVFRGYAFLERNEEKLLEYGQRYLDMALPYTNFRAITMTEIAQVLLKRWGPNPQSFLLALRALGEDPTNPTAWDILGAAAADRANGVTASKVLRQGLVGDPQRQSRGDHGHKRCSEANAEAR